MKDRMVEFLRDKWKRYGIYIIVAALAFLLGAATVWKVFVSPLRTQVDDLKAEVSWYESLMQQPKDGASGSITEEAKTNTVIQYVPKERIVYKNTDGTTSEVQEKTDVQMDVASPDIYVKYNGTEYQLPGIKGETQKFQDGKVVGEVTTKSTLDVSGIVNKEVEYELRDREKHFSYGVYGTNDGILGTLGYSNKGNEFDVIFKPTDPGGQYGVGWVRRF